MALAKDIDPDEVIEWELLGRKYRMSAGLAETIEELLDTLTERYMEEEVDDLGEPYDHCITCMTRTLILATTSQVILGMENGLVE